MKGFYENFTILSPRFLREKDFIECLSKKRQPRTFYINVLLMKNTGHFTKHQRKKLNRTAVDNTQPKNKNQKKKTSR